MATAQTRKFAHAPAKLTRVPLIIELIGPSGTGKTKSALRLVDGIARQGKDTRPTFVVDTEARRALHYAKEHRFEHVEFQPQHSPLDYLDVLDYCIDRGAGRIVIDSMSHEHEGEGGVLQWHQTELDRLGGNMKRTFEAWAAPKQARRRLINRMVSSGVDLILCFRASRKIKPGKGREQPPIDLGWVPVGGHEFMYEATARLLLLPGARGVPTFRSNFPGEQEMIKLPGQFEALFARSPQLSEDIGEQLARWAGGGEVAAVAGPGGLPDLLTRLGACSDPDTLQQLSDEGRALWRKIDATEQKRVKTAIDAAVTRVKMIEAQAASAARAMAEAAADGADKDEGFVPEPAAEPDESSAA